MAVWHLSTTADKDPVRPGEFVTTGHWVDIRVPPWVWRRLLRITAWLAQRNFRRIKRDAL